MKKPDNTASTPAASSLEGQSFRDGEGQRWWVRGRRPGPEGQFVIEAEVKASYPKFDLYVMTEPEFREHARAAHLKREMPQRTHKGR